MFSNCLPHLRLKIIRKSSEIGADIGTQVNQPLCYESANDTVFHAEILSVSFLSEIISNYLS